MALSLHVGASQEAFLPSALGVESMSSEVLDEAAREEARAAVPLQGPLVPAVLTLLVHKDNVAFLQLDFRLALGRVRDHHAVPGGETDTTVGEAGPGRLEAGPGSAGRILLFLFCFLSGVKCCNLVLLFPLKKKFFSTYL